MSAGSESEKGSVGTPPEVTETPVTNSTGPKKVVPRVEGLRSNNVHLFNLDEKTYGVKRIEVLAKQYKSPFAYVVFFFSIFLVAYAYGLDATMRGTLQGYATSSYSEHSRIATVNVVRSATSALAQPIYARLSDNFGRLELFLVSIVLYVVGTIVMSQAYDFPRFAGGSVLWQFGYSGVIILIQIMSADASTLNWRVACSFVAALPFIINTWVSGNIIELAKDNWSWNIGFWAFAFPLACLPLICCFLHMWFLSIKNGDMKRLKEEDQSDFRRLGFKKFIVEVFFWKLDFVGLFLLTLVIGLILVPISVAGGIDNQWATADILVPFFLGWACIPFFAVWEIKYARNPLLPSDMVKDRAVWSALFIGVFLTFIWYMQGDFLYAVLVVSFNESANSAQRIASLYSFASVITGSLLGLVLVRIRRLKPFVLFGVSGWMLAFGLLIHYRGDTRSHGGVIGAQVLLGFFAGFFTYPVQASIQAVVDHERMAIALALYLTSYNIGGAIGGAVSGAVWQDIMPRELMRGFADFTNTTLPTFAYGAPYAFIVEYPWGTPERDVVVEAYKYTQKILCIIGVCLCIPLIGAAFLLRNPELKSVQSFELDAHTTTDEEGEKYYEKEGYKAEKNSLWQRMMNLFKL
ncbi:BA75_03886T0 [Komagataella pastoris]|uniref:BA75_03886T0 n=1 Tax=Komagataella pastoris TaxID=4922 RepID=A0A1B2JET1_PICPA|nr:BA75_03886T0 [Komagataella pastoris]